MPAKLKGRTVGKNMDSTMKYVLIAALVILLAFAFVYIYNIHNSKVERYTTEEEESSIAKVVYMYMNGCSHCREFSPVFDEYSRSSQLHGVRFEAIEHNEDGAAQYASEVVGFPTVLVVKNKNIVAKQVGNVPYNDLKQFVEQSIQKTF